MVRVQQRLGVSERRACEVLGQARSTQRRSRKRGADEAALRADVVKVAGRFGRYGYRMVTGMLRAEGWVTPLASLVDGLAERAFTGLPCELTAVTRNC